jgi:hypothetical protein
MLVDADIDHGRLITFKEYQEKDEH